MPCMSYDDDPGYNDREWKRKTDMLARIACKALTQLESTTHGEFDELMQDEEVRTWWNAHKIADSKARAAREEKARLHKLRNEALAKLSKEERIVLGIK